MLSLTSNWKAMVREFNSVVSDARMQEDFVVATNNLLDELSFRADLTTPLAHIYNYTDNITGLDEEDSWTVHDGLVFHLIKIGKKHVRGDDAYKIAKIEWDERVGQFMTKKSYEDQDDVETEGDGASIIGLGDVTAGDDR